LKNNTNGQVYLQLNVQTFPFLLYVDNGKIKAVYIFFFYSGSIKLTSI
jgi:hypothetical protein